MPQRDDDLDLTVVPDLSDTSATPEMAPSTSGLATAKKAVQILAEKHGYIAPTAIARRHVAMAFAAKNKVVYGKAFDALRVVGATDVDFADFDSVEKNIDAVVLCEVKSTRRELDDDFSGYFFGLSTAELLVAQSLGSNFEFALVNTESGDVTILTLKGLLERVKAIYPAWSLVI